MPEKHMNITGHQQTLVQKLKQMAREIVALGASTTQTARPVLASRHVIQPKYIQKRKQKQQP